MDGAIRGLGGAGFTIPNDNAGACEVPVPLVLDDPKSPEAGLDVSVVREEAVSLGAKLNRLDVWAGVDTAGGGAGAGADNWKEDVFFSSDLFSIFVDVAVPKENPDVAFDVSPFDFSPILVPNKELVFLSSFCVFAVVAFCVSSPNLNPLVKSELGFLLSKLDP